MHKNHENEIKGGKPNLDKGVGFLFADFLPMLIYVLVQCGIVAAEIEADFMWGLIHPSLLNGEGGYYLTSLSSAVLALKNFKNMQGSLRNSQQVR
jgi:hypothetical protein